MSIDTASPTSARSTVPAGFIQRSHPEPEERESVAFDNRINSVLHGWLFAYRNRPDQSNSTIADALGYRSGSTISRYLSGKPEGNIEELESRIADLRARVGESAAVAPVATGIVQTSVLRQFSAVATSATATGTRAVILGEAGIGKTVAAMEFCRRNPTAVMITLDRHDRDECGIKRLLWETFQVRGKGWRQTSRWKLILDHYAGSGRVLIIDQAQRLTMGGLYLLHDFSDKTGVAQVQIGNPDLVDLIGQDAQNHRRTFTIHPLQLKRSAEVARKLVDLHAAEHATDELYSLASEWIDRPGRIGLLVNSLRMANDYVLAPEFGGDYLAAFASARAKSIHEFAPYKAPSKGH